MAINSIGGFPQPVSTPATGAAASTGKTAATPAADKSGAAPQQFLVRSITGAKAPSFGFIIEQRDAEAIRSQLRETLSVYFNVFYKKESDAKAAIDKTMSSMEGLVDKAVSDDSVESFDFRLAQVSTSYGDSGGSFASIFGIGLEAGLVRDGKVTVDDTKLADLNGAEIKLKTSQLAAGFRDARYNREENPQNSIADIMLDKRMQSAIDQLRQTQQALTDFRNGNSSALTPLIDRFLQGSPALSIKA
ncbi:MAG: hypothetical protein KKB63_12240 [Alphaproteobacteria bacterium]|nr:hypothetical protein [Alphaproteobacteria bacterium]